MSNWFPYAERARKVEEARNATIRTRKGVKPRSDSNDAPTAKWHDGVARFHAALGVAYPPNFWVDLEAPRSGDARPIETAIAFLEVDPMFFRSGYAKERALRAIKRLPLSASQMDRPRTVVLRIAATRDGREFRDYCHLARRLDDTGFRQALAALQSAGDAAASRRAGWMLDALDQKPRKR